MSKAPRARDLKQQRAKSTRTDILQAAIDLFARRGILATTMAELARTIGMTPGALYWHFPTKEDLLLAAIDALHQRFLDEFSSLLTESRKWTAKQQLRAFVQRTQSFLRAHGSHGIFYGMVGAEAAENNARVAQALRDSLSIYVDALANIIRYGQKKTLEFRDDIDPMMLAYSLNFATIGLVLHQNLFSASVPYDPLVSTMHQVILDGVDRRP